ncbi:MAG: class I SAM-dependent methyltransferase [Gammaproteobacteria bacterium]|nr:class I SAM-dependent methyltransferase [Gammaproteobacteria bacterium]
MNRKSHWEDIYLNKPPLEVSWYQKEPAISLQLISNTGISTDAAIIDIGGGASTLVDRLNGRGYKHLAVLDISGNALAYAKKRFASAADKIEWFEADITTFQSPHQFDLWHDRAVFHFLTEANDRKHYIKTLKQTLKPGGHLIMAAFAIGGPTKCSGLDIVQYDANKLLAELGSGFTLVEENSEIHVTPTNKEQQFAYFRFVKEH